MEVKKKELIISIVLMVVFVVIAINFNVLAANEESENGMTWEEYQQSKGNETGNETGNEIDNNNIPLITVIDGNNNATLNNDANENNPDQLADTGLEDTPWLIVGICVISAAFAYKKIKEYKMD